MSRLHLSQSEVFWHAALHARLQPLTADIANEEFLKYRGYLSQSFPGAIELMPYDVDPLAALEEIAVDFGLAKPASLEAAGSEGMSPHSSLYDDEVPHDIEWVLEDGTPVTTPQLEELVSRIAAAGAHATKPGEGDEPSPSDTYQALAMHPEGWLQIMATSQMLIPPSLRHHCHGRHAAAMGSHIAEGIAWSDPTTIYRVDWRGRYHRFRITQQPNPAYAALILRFVDEFQPSWRTRLSLFSEWTRTNADPDLIDSIRHSRSDPSGRRSCRKGDTPHLTSWLNDLQKTHGDTPEWTTAYFLQDAVMASRLLERYVRLHGDILRSAGRDHEGLARTSTTFGKVEQYCATIRKKVDDSLLELMTRAAPLSEAAAEEQDRLSARFIALTTRQHLLDAAECARGLNLPEVCALAENGVAAAKEIDEALHAHASGRAGSEMLYESCRRLADIASGARKLVYGQLYFRELAAEGVYIDPGTRARLLREPKAIREQIAEAISQYERQTLPNCTVTSACGLIEPTARRLAETWLPHGSYGGDTADVLGSLLSHLLKRKSELRDESRRQGKPHPDTARNLEQLYCANLAFALHSIGNSVRHYPEKVLKRHDAGVMLHGLCSLLHRISS